MENVKKPIGIVVDEAADLTKEIIDKYNIGVVPLNVHWPEIENIPGDNIYQKIKELEKRGDKSFGKTSQPSPKAFIDVFTRQLDSFEEIISLSITSKHSGTYNSACQAKKFMGENGNRIFPVDTLNASAGTSLIVFKLIDLVEKGLKTEAILKELEVFMSQIRLYILVESPSRLEASGRLSPMLANWFRNFQKMGIRPLLGFKEGKLGPIGVKKSKDMVSTLLDEYEGKTKSFRSENKKIWVAITHGDDVAGAEKLKGLLEGLGNVEVKLVNLADNVLGTLVGPGALVLAWAPAG
ncbi:MAG: DegV family protein [Candidatus Pacebacteria bacterium]|nr:DegV family protein [Candidatus Paceibacterota bacterium]